MAQSLLDRIPGLQSPNFPAVLRDRTNLVWHLLALSPQGLVTSKVVKATVALLYLNEYSTTQHQLLQNKAWFIHSAKSTKHRDWRLKTVMIYTHYFTLNLSLQAVICFRKPSNLHLWVVRSRLPLLQFLPFSLCLLASCQLSLMCLGQLWPLTQLSLPTLF